MEMNNLPFVAAGHTLMGRWYNRFSFGSSFVVEAVWRGIHCVMVPSDKESLEFEPHHLRDCTWAYPESPGWYREVWFPYGVPVPTP